MNRQFFTQMLQQASPDELAQHSMLNHHADGMDYICLHRSPKLTVKIYLLEDPQNRNGGFLVNPHSHRYSFSTTVLAGALTHIRYREERPCPAGTLYDAHRYVAESQSIEKGERVSLVGHWRVHAAAADQTYWVSSDEIHTIEVFEGRGPLMFGLVQHQDVATASVLYLRPDDEMRRSKKRVPTPVEYEALRRRALQLI